MKGQMEDVKKGKEIPHIRRLLDESRLISQVYANARCGLTSSSLATTAKDISHHWSARKEPAMPSFFLSRATFRNVFNKRCLFLGWPEINDCFCIADDHTRVRLRSKLATNLDNGGDESERSEDYLNANFVDGFRQPRAYIATQGPIQGTFAAFWKMIWEQNTQVIVMITHLFENGKVWKNAKNTHFLNQNKQLITPMVALRSNWDWEKHNKLVFLQPKCDLYWPDVGTETYGDMVVSFLREDILASYTLRTFSIRFMKSSNGNGTVSKKEMVNMERTVYQYHFTAWPDHGVPLHALPLVSFVRNSAAANAIDSGPIVVHCRYFFSL